MNTSSPSDSADFNGFGAYRRKRASVPPEQDGARPKRSFRHIADDGFAPAGPENLSEEDHGADESGIPNDQTDRKFHAGRKPFGKKPFGRKYRDGKKPFGGKFGGKKQPRPSFREFSDAMDDAPAPDSDFPEDAPARSFRDRSFKHANRPPRRGDSPYPPHGKGKPFGKFRHTFSERPPRDDAPPQPLRRPYGASSGEEPDNIAPDGPSLPPFGKKPFGKKKFARKPFTKKYVPRPQEGEFPDGDSPFTGRKPFGKKPFRKGKSFGKKPFGKKFAPRKPDGAFPDGDALSAGHKPFGKKPFFHKGKPFGKKPFGKKPLGKGKPFGRKPPRRPQ